MQRGFSLLELSIVLVIIGLITGGIMAGRSMVRAAELRSVMSDIRKFQSAVNTFRDKYQAVPGDMRNAVKYWGAQAGGTADGLDSTCTAVTTAATGTATCNGNGNGNVDLYTEMFRFWQHLANAGLIEGQYSGVSGSNTAYEHLIGVNCPSSKTTGGGYSIWYNGTMSGSTQLYDGYYGNEIRFGAVTTGSFTDLPLLSAPDAYSIDQKLDDGLPGQGNIVTFISTYFPGCATTASAATAAYTLTGTANACSLIFKQQF